MPDHRPTRPHVSRWPIAVEVGRQPAVDSGPDTKIQAGTVQQVVVAGREYLQNRIRMKCTEQTFAGDKLTRGTSLQQNDLGFLNYCFFYKLKKL